MTAFGIAGMLHRLSLTAMAMKCRVVAHHGAVAWEVAAYRLPSSNMRRAGTVKRLARTRRWR